MADFAIGVKTGQGNVAKFRADHGKFDAFAAEQMRPPFNATEIQGAPDKIPRSPAQNPLSVRRRSSWAVEGSLRTNTSLSPTATGAPMATRP